MSWKSALSIFILLNLAFSSDSYSSDSTDIKVHQTTQKLSGKLLFSEISSERSSIWMLDLETKALSRVSALNDKARMPALSPDHTKIAYSKEENGIFKIYILDLSSLDTYRATKLDQGSEEHPNWSSDGKSLFFTLGREGREAGDSKIAKVSLSDHKTKVVVDKKGRNSVPKISPDNKEILYSTDRFWPGWDLCKTRLDSLSEDCFLGGALTNCRGSWSKTGKEIVYSEGLGSRIGLKIYDLTNQSSRELFDGPGPEYDVGFDSSDKYFVFAADQKKDGRYKIFVMRFGESPELLIDSKSSVRDPNWN